MGAVLRAPIEQGVQQGLKSVLKRYQFLIGSYDIQSYGMHLINISWHLVLDIMYMYNLLLSCGVRPSHRYAQG